jgi:hypothetical protein
MVELTQTLGRALEHCREIHMVLPFIATVVSSNGCVFAVRYENDPDAEGLRAAPLAEHTEGPGFILPINIMIMDQTGEAIRVAITAAGEAYH